MDFDMLLFGLTIAMAFSSIIIVFVGIINHRHFHGYKGIAILFVLMVFYNFGYALELATDSFELKILFNHIQYVGIPFIAVTWMFIAKRFTSKSYVWKFKKNFWFLIVPVLVFITAQLFYFTNLEWYYTGARLIEYTGLSSHSIWILELDKGVVYYIHQSYNMVMIAYVSWLYIHRAITVKGIHKRQAIAMATCGIIATFMIIPAFFTTTTSSIDWTLYFLNFIGYGIIYTMYHYEMMALMPSAHKSMFIDSTDPMLVFDDKHDLVSWNDSIGSLHLKNISYQTNLIKIFTDEDIIKAIKNTEPFSFNHKDKHYVMEITKLESKHKIYLGYVLRFLEMTSYVERITKLDYEASHDSLTDILNRRAFFMKIETYLKDSNNTNTPFSIIMFDIDDFKAVNDQYGHLAGDQVLISLSRIVEKLLPNNALFCRFGGEEFLIFIINLSEDDTFRLAENIRKIVEISNFEFESNIIKIKTSLGISHTIIKPDVDVYNSIKKADEALYISKHRGKNQVTVSTD